MAEKQVEAVDVINMNKYFTSIIICCFVIGMSQAQTNTSQGTYKKKVLETSEVDFLMSYYTQEGNHASVTGGIGNEKLTDVTPTFIVAIPLNADDVLTVNAGISAYTSASSSNLDPFDSSGASRKRGDDDDKRVSARADKITGSPWVESSGASRSDIWATINASYSHSSDDRNNIWTADLGFSKEYDYASLGFGGGFTKLFNQKNTELRIKGQVYLDNWNPRYPTELDSYLEAGQNLNNGFFANIDILDQLGNVINKNGSLVWSPLQTLLVTNKSRNSYSLSFNFSQIISKKAQFSLFF